MNAPARCLAATVTGWFQAASTSRSRSGRADLDGYHASIGGPKGFLLHEALKSVWLTVARANEYVDRQAPWKLAKDTAKRGELEKTLASLVRQLARQAVHLWPFMPKKTEELWRSLGAPGSPGAFGFAGLSRLDVAGWKAAPGQPLFPKESAKDGQTRLRSLPI